MLPAASECPALGFLGLRLATYLGGAGSELGCAGSFTSGDGLLEVAGVLVSAAPVLLGAAIVPESD